MPYTQAGYWPSDLNTNDSVVYLTCQPASACPGGLWQSALCATGYTERRCGICELGYYKLNGECSVCPKSSGFWLTVTLYVLPAGAVLAGVLLLVSKLRLEGDILHHRRQLLPAAVHVQSVRPQLARSG